MPVIELTTTGRRSGQARTTMLTSPYQEGSTMVVVASRGGDDHHPAWYLNLRDDPEVTVSVGGKPAQPMRAETADPEARARLWPLITADHHNSRAISARRTARYQWYYSVLPANRRRATAIREGAPVRRVGGGARPSGADRSCAQRVVILANAMSTIWVCNNNESSPRGVLAGPGDGYARPPRFNFPGVGILNVETHRGRSGLCTRRKDASLVVTSVVPVQNDLSRGPSDNDNDLIFKTHRQPKSVDVERLRLAEVTDVENQTVVVINLHVHDATESGWFPSP